ncbi:MAG: RagB/SusD family nutrient uptake outer membrane protein [Bacteroidales bacterium]|nr:RagB/SusD family nutrient uptake outer membrane protein [Bacteroidales bacterium]
MKKIIKYIFLAVLLPALAASCENAAFLDQVPYSKTSPENFYRTEADMKMALVSCYEIINGHKIPGYSFVQRGSYGLGLIYMMNAPADDIVSVSSSSDEGLEMFWCNYTESTRCIRDAWKVLYAGVARCNIILHYIDNVDMADDAKVQYKAEARFMRAFFYYHLAWLFGGVPLVTSYDSAGQEPRSPLEDVYGFILADLEYAWRNSAPEGVLQTSSAGKYTAAAYVARICNYLAACRRSGTGASLVAEQPLNDFSFVDADAMTEMALETCRDVVEHSQYVLIDDYANLFRETTKAQQYRECMLLAENPLSGSEGYWPNSFYLPTPVNSGIDSPNVYGGRNVPTPRAFYMYHPEDPRRDHNFTGRLSDGKKKVMVDGYTYWDPAPPVTTVKIAVDASGNPVPDSGEGVATVEVPHPLYDNLRTQTYLPISGMQLCAGKFRLCSFDELQHTWQQHAVSYPLMRLADVYLMYAEALYFSGDEPGARVWLDKVLERAVKDRELFEEIREYYRRDDFVEELLESRERELIFEFSRKYDLIRFNMIDEKIMSLDEDRCVEREGTVDDKYLVYQTDGYLHMSIPVMRQNWSYHKIWLPISEEQRGVNKNLVQNAGWGL